ncbi:NAD-dependent epimerase/dehydratase family protein [Glaciibacter flavus]|uniref:NAD-dependent epimerase/dehydratase family protein n=1 Tax=Orlajensenia flava TaxID=2565934 RepID=A0A4S4FVY1_9MICO|nr:NAD(P)H-binding protein [Glaciibacter flavus]THG34045.1 NAD-dependent epimerase/dehydratase family protein [Glaciibacter flavus]
MARITIIGGTGYAGSHLVAAAVARGHRVTSYSRRTPSSPPAGAKFIAFDLLDGGQLPRAALDTDVLISALSPRGPLAGQTRQLLADLAERARAEGVRFGVIGGAGTLRISENGPVVQDTEHVPAEFKAEAREMGAVLGDLRESDQALDWFYVSPAAGFGSWAPGAATGTYRIGSDVLLTDSEGNSEISGADLADAVMNEIESPRHRRARFSIAY